MLENNLQISRRDPIFHESPTNQFTKRGSRPNSPALSDQSELDDEARPENAKAALAKGEKLIQINEQNAKTYGATGNWPADPSLPDFSLHYEPPETEPRTIKVTPELAKALAPFHIAAGTSLNTQQFKIESKEKDPDGETGVVMDADFDAKEQLTFISDVWKNNDHNAKANKMVSSQLLMSGILKTNTKPKAVVRQNIVNIDTRYQILQAIKLEGAVGDSITLKLTDTGDKLKWFTTLVGSDNGRNVQEMLNFYRKHFQGYTITEILITSGKTSTPFLTLIIGPSHHISK